MSCRYFYVFRVKREQIITLCDSFTNEEENIGNKWKSLCGVLLNICHVNPVVSWSRIKKNRFNDVRRLLGEITFKYSPA